MSLRDEARPPIRTWVFSHEGTRTEPITADTWYKARQQACIQLKCDWSQVITCTTL